MVSIFELIKGQFRLVTDPETSTLKVERYDTSTGEWVTVFSLDLSEVSYFRVPLLMLPPISGIDASSTGVKLSAVRIPFSAKLVKSLKLRAECSAITSGATVRVGIYNVTKGEYVCYIDFTATGESEVEATSLPSDGDILELRIECTTSVSGGTFDLNYALAYVDYSYS